MTDFYIKIHLSFQIFFPCSIFKNFTSSSSLINICLSFMDIFIELDIHPFISQFLRLIFSRLFISRSWQKFSQFWFYLLVCRNFFVIIFFRFKILILFVFIHIEGFFVYVNFSWFHCIFCLFSTCGLFLIIFLVCRQFYHLLYFLLGWILPSDETVSFLVPQPQIEFFSFFKLPSPPSWSTCLCKKFAHAFQTPVVKPLGNFFFFEKDFTFLTVFNFYKNWFFQLCYFCIFAIFSIFSIFRIHCFRKVVFWIHFLCGEKFLED